MIFKALKSELLRFKFQSLRSKKPEFNLSINKKQTKTDIKCFHKKSYKGSEDLTISFRPSDSDCFDELGLELN